MLFIASSILYPNFFYQAKYVHFWVNTHVRLYFDLYVLNTKKTLDMFNRPGVAGAILQTASSLIDWSID